MIIDNLSLNFTLCINDKLTYDMIMNYWRQGLVSQSQTYPLEMGLISHLIDLKRRLFHPHILSLPFLQFYLTIFRRKVSFIL